jgi:hypothetical protein
MYIYLTGGVYLYFKKDNVCYDTYLDFYIKEVKPCLKDIDIFIKSCSLITPLETATLLNITMQEVFTIMKNQNIKEINKASFFTIMSFGSSTICTMYKREILVGSPYIYSCDNIAYIYNIELNLVKNACNNLGIKIITSLTLPLIFKEILI